MEASLLLAALAGAGYLLQPKRADVLYEVNLQDKESGEVAHGAGQWPLQDRPTLQTNLYDARRVDEVRGLAQNRANVRAEAARRPEQTNVIPEGYGPLDGAGGSSFAQFAPHTPPPSFEPFHNNMQPFFGSTVKQVQMHEAKLDLFTGAAPEWVAGKKEVDAMFRPRPNAPSGEAPRDLTRFHSSEGRQSEKPFEPTQVRQRPLTEADYRPASKTVEELRGGSRAAPLIVPGRTVQGLHTTAAQRGMVGATCQNRAPRTQAVEWERHVPQRAAVDRAPLAPEVIDRPTHRQDLAKVPVPIAPAGPAQGVKASLRATPSEEPKRIGLLGDFLRNVWATVLGRGAQDTHGREGVQLPETVRAQQPHHPKLLGNVEVVGATRRGPAQRPDAPLTTLRELYAESRRAANVKGPSQLPEAGEAPATTLKETLLHETHRANLRGGVQRGKMAPTDRAKTTVAETLVHDAQRLNVRGGAAKGTTPFQDRARTTVADTLLHDAQRLNLRGAAQGKLSLADLARTTVRDTTLHDPSKNPAALDGLPAKGAAVDRHALRPKTTVRDTTLHRPVDMPGQADTIAQRGPAVDRKALRPRTTMKEAATHDAYGVGNVGPGGQLSMGTQAHGTGLSDAARVTHRETLTAVSGVMGPMAPGEGLVRGGYVHKVMEAPETDKETLLTERTGGADRAQTGAYVVMEMDAPATGRQETHVERVGGATTAVSASMSQEAAKTFRTNEDKEHLSRGRTPTAQGSKTTPGPEELCLETKKEGLQVATRAVEYGQRVHAQSTDIQSLGADGRGVQEYRQIEAERLDPDLLEPFRQNPYTQSLHSSA